LVIVCVFAFLLSAKPALGWSNGGYSDNPAQQDYGTHDWIAQHALQIWLFLGTFASLSGTELPNKFIKTTLT